MIDYLQKEGRLLAEPKKKMKERGLKSPERRLRTVELARGVVLPPRSPFHVHVVSF